MGKNVHCLQFFDNAGKILSKPLPQREETDIYGAASWGKSHKELRGYTMCPFFSR
jgi:hypothetical protein